MLKTEAASHLFENHTRSVQSDGKSHGPLIRLGKARLDVKCTVQWEPGREQWLLLWCYCPLGDIRTVLETFRVVAPCWQ